MQRPVATSVRCDNIVRDRHSGEDAMTWLVYDQLRD